MNYYKKHDWLNNTAKKAHENAANKGFYEGEFSTIESRKTKAFLLRQKNLIRSEIGEGYEALRKGEIGENKLLDFFQHITKDAMGLLTNAYEACLKGTLGEELADVVIRALDCAVALQIKFSEEGDDRISGWREDDDMDGIFDYFYTVVDEIDSFIWTRKVTEFGEVEMYEITSAIRELIMYSFDVANHYNINLDKHIELKMLYNSMREHKHGKKF